MAIKRTDDAVLKRTDADKAGEVEGRVVQRFEVYRGSFFCFQDKEFLVFLDRIANAHIHLIDITCCGSFYAVFFEVRRCAIEFQVFGDGACHHTVDRHRCNGCGRSFFLSGGLGFSSAAQ
jgi:hypothetical protein